MNVAIIAEKIHNADHQRFYCINENYGMNYNVPLQVRILPTVSSLEKSH